MLRKLFLCIVIVVLSYGCDKDQEPRIDHHPRLTTIKILPSIVRAGTSFSIIPEFQNSVLDTIHFEFTLKIKVLTDSIFRPFFTCYISHYDTLTMIAPDSSNSYLSILCRIYSSTLSDTLTTVIRIHPFDGALHPLYSGMQNTCSQCHLSYVTAWTLTRHSNAGSHRFNNPTWQHNCNSCHSTGYDLGRDNGGFDERPITRFDHVQCESCHGPSEFYGIGFTNHQVSMGFVESSVSRNQCNSCHQYSHSSVYEDWTQSSHSQSSSSNHLIHQTNPSEQNECAGCHIYSEAIKRLKGQFSFVYPSDNSKFEGIGCAVCHTAHPINQTFTWKDLRLPPDQLCQVCHQINIDPVPSLNFFPNHPQNDFLSHNRHSILESNSIGLLSSSSHIELSNHCEVCHLYPLPWSFGMNKISSHTFQAHWASCQSCHLDVTNNFILEQQQSYRDSLDVLLSRIETLKDRGDTLSLTFQKSRWYYHFLIQDGSWGIHNPTWTGQIIRYSLVQLDSIIS